MKRILFVTNSLSGGGAERSINTLVNELYSNGFDVGVIAINSSNPDVIHLNCNLFELNRPHKSGLFKTVLVWLKFQLLIIKMRPDVLVLNCELPELFGAFTIFRKKIICVQHIGYANVWENRRKIGLLVRLLLILRRVQWVKVSDHIQIWPKNKRPLTVIKNPLFVVERSITLFSGKVKRLVFIGRLTDQKDPLLIVGLADSCKLPLLMIGSGELSTRILIKSSELKVDITLLEFLPNPWSLIKNGDLLIVPSKYEGDGLVVLEALKQQIPILVSEIEAFKVFNLPKINYSSSLSDFRDKIHANANFLESFVVHRSHIDSIIEERQVQNIANQWVRLLDFEY
jgi:glycosyltransferase involved in cell wall biosynthesis